MGRNTSEFGYQYGLTPGQPAYPHMTHFIFSESIAFDHPHPKVNVVSRNLIEIDNIRKIPTTDIYLCGGGQLAGWLLDNQKTDIIKRKLNPLIQGQGTKLFGESASTFELELIENGPMSMVYKY